MNKSGVYLGCLGLAGLSALLIGILAQLMNATAALLVGGAVMSLVFGYWFNRSYQRGIQRSRRKIPGDFNIDGD